MLKIHNILQEGRVTLLEEGVKKYISLVTHVNLLGPL